MEPATNIDERVLLPVRLPKGFVLGGYVVDGWLRDGGMASIYRARRMHDELRVTLKLQLPSTAHDRMIQARFDREAAVMRRAANDPHVVEILDAGTLADGRRYLVLEWVEGENLEDLLDFLRNQDQRLSIVRACRIGRDVARGLSELHEHGVLHLDLKPANVMVGRSLDGHDEVKLIDFGVAADLHETELEPHATPVMGTSGYMAPEQLHGAAPNPTFDVYALGVLMFESLAGTSVPPDGWTPETLPRVETRRRGVPTQLADLVHACMDFDPARRPASAREVTSELVRIIRVLESEARRGRGDASARARVCEGSARTGRTELVPHVSAVRGRVVRTGGTDVAPRSEMLAEAPARTGGTEVVPIEELLARSTKGRVVTSEAQRPSVGSDEGATSEDASVLRSGAVPKTIVPSQAAESLRDRRLDEERLVQIDATLDTTSLGEASTPAEERVVELRDDDLVRHPPSGRTQAVEAPRGSEAIEACGDDLTEEAPTSGSTARSDARPLASKSATAPRGVDPDEPWAEEGALSKGSLDTWNDEDEPRPRGWLRWATLGAAAVVLATWCGWHGRSGDDPVSAASEEAHDGAAISTVRATEVAQEPDAAATHSEQQHERRTEPGLAAEDESPRAPRNERAAAKAANEPRTATVDSDACRKARTGANEATKALAWRKVLRLTEQRGCWASTMHRLERKRLRVQAYAELGDFRKCVREAGGSTDEEIASRVGYCMNGLRAG